jgi:hypothetical protein
MAKRLIFLIALGFPAYLLGHPGGRLELIATYRAAIGVRELTGNNDGPQVKQYLGAVGLPEGYAWCAAFVAYCHMQHNIPYPVKAPAWSPAWFPAARIIPSEKARTADVFGLYYPRLNRIGHVGFLDEDWDNGSGTILTVEGNTNGEGSREGDGVYRKRRSKKQIQKVSRWAKD